MKKKDLNVSIWTWLKFVGLCELELALMEPL